MSHSKNSVGDGYPRVGIFSTNSNQHDGRSAGQERWSGSSQNITNKFNMTNKYSKHSAVDGGSESIINLSKSYYPYQVGSEIKNTNSFNLSPPTYGHHDLLEEYSLYKSRSESRSSSSSANSTGTVCESEIFPYGAGIKPHQRTFRSTSPPWRTLLRNPRPRVPPRRSRAPGALFRALGGERRRYHPRARIIASNARRA